MTNPNHEVPAHELLDGACLQARLRDLMATSSTAMLAVAFWGDGAIEQLGLLKSKCDLRIICNLTMGGTNPRVIRTLRDGGIDVCHLNRLHAKLYVFDTEYVIGSANVSANGLSFQGSESSWLEANVIGRDKNLHQSCEALFEQLWGQAKRVLDSDLELAEEAWSRRRKLAGSLEVKSPTESLWGAYSRNISAIQDKRVFLVIDTQPLSSEAEKKVSKEREIHAQGKNLDGYENWHEMPNDAYFVCFWVDARGGVSFTGFYYAPSEREERRLSGSGRLQLIYKAKSILGFRSVGPIKAWANLIQRYFDKHPSARKEGFAVEMGELARGLNA